MGEKLVLVSHGEVTASPLSTLTVGSEVGTGAVTVTVTGVNERRLLLDIADTEWTLDRQWQVLAVTEPEPIVCFVSSLDTDLDGTVGDLLEELLARMRANADDGLLWLNIEPARRMMAMVKDTRLDANTLDKAALCRCVVSERLLDERDVPRLLLSFARYGTLALERADKHSPVAADEHDDAAATLDAACGRLATMVSPALTVDERYNAVANDFDLAFDPVQLTPEWEDCIAEVEAEVDWRIGGTPRTMGFCFVYWSFKRDALAARGITWHSPALMNPCTLFD